MRFARSAIFLRQWRTVAFRLGNFRVKPSADTLQTAPI
jgi:hypothetical protein